MDNHPQTELYISVIHGGHNDVTGSDFINFPSGGLPSNRQLSLASDFSDGWRHWELGRRGGNPFLTTTASG